MNPSPPTLFMTTTTAMAASLAILLAPPLSAAGATKVQKTRDQLVLEDRDSLENNADWIYNDLDRGFAEARRTGKPLFVAIRCIP